jgi:hypothetical protein
MNARRLQTSNMITFGWEDWWVIIEALWRRSGCQGGACAQGERDRIGTIVPGPARIPGRIIGVGQEGWRGSPQRRCRTRFDTHPTPAQAHLSTVRPWTPSDPRPSLLFSRRGAPMFPILGYAAPLSCASTPGRTCSMDADRFDALSRSLSDACSRRGVLASLLGATLGLVGLDRTEAKKKCPPCKKRKNGKCKKNKPDGTACPGGACQRGVCQPTPAPEDPCPGQRLCDGACIPTNQCCTAADCPAGYQCCSGVCSDTKKLPFRPCSQDIDCCSGYCQQVEEDLFGIQLRCAETCRGRPCLQGCCRGFPCQAVDTDSGSFRCGGCKDAGDICETDAECCFSACSTIPNFNKKQCHSYPGQPCARNYDCLSCSGLLEICTATIDGILRHICSDGVCGCPDTSECCVNKPCLNPEESCFFDADTLHGECRSLSP